MSVCIICKTKFSWSWSLLTEDEPCECGAELTYRDALKLSAHERVEAEEWQQAWAKLQRRQREGLPCS